MSSNQVAAATALALVCGTTSGCRLRPSDDELVARVISQRAALDALARLCDEDGATVVWDKGHGVEAPKPVAWERSQQYAELFGKVDIGRIRRTESGGSCSSR